MIYLDNAATTYPKPASVKSAVARGFDEYFANPGRGGYDASEKAAEAVFSCRKKLGEMFGCPPDRVVFTANCTAALNICLKGLLKPGDHVICSSLEHNAVMRPLYSLQQIGVEVEVAEVIFGDMQATVNSFSHLIKPSTKVIVCTHASNVLGTALPIEEIGRLCSDRNIKFVVDGAQSAGILPLDMAKMNIGYLCIAAHKGLYAPVGTGALLCRDECPRTLIEGGTGTNSRSPVQPDELPERLESGTLNTGGILGISAGVDFVNLKTREKIYNHEMSLLSSLYANLEKMHSVMLYTAAPRISECVPVLSFNIAGLSGTQTAAFLNKEGIAVRAGLHCAPSAHKRIGTLDLGTVRIAPSAFTTREEMNRVAKAIERLDFRQKNARAY